MKWIFLIAVSSGFVLMSNRAAWAAYSEGVPMSVAWKIPNGALPYLAELRKAEQENGLPAGLLVRVAYQESRFREDIISGSTKSGAGAVGLMQIVPRWHPTVNPYDPFASIHYAAGYLRKLYKQFGTWSDALAAYNWGPGNLKSLGFDKAPKETRDYVAQIGSDVSLT